jgi:hypothetical protein
MNFAEIILCITLYTLMGSQVFADTGLDEAKAHVATSVANLNTIGKFTQQLCSDTQFTCNYSGLTSGNAVSLPSNYMPTIPTDPTALNAGTTYTFTSNARSDGTVCFSLEGTGSIIQHDALLSVPQQDGTYATENDAAAGGYLHYDSRTSNVYWTSSNVSPIAGGC